MDWFWNEFAFDAVDYPRYFQVLSRLTAAALLAGIVGLERAQRGREAGLRTHMLVGLGSALFTILPTLAFGSEAQLAEVVKGIAAGIGFLGAGTILKNLEKQQIEGLTTAASIWTTAALGMAVGAGYYAAAIIATLLAWIILVPVRWLEIRMHLGDDAKPLDRR
jgi:putative Mg2+ transporter-C (MgtC) family protein